MNTSEFLAISGAICPEKEAIIFEDKRFTFSQLNERVNRLAHSLQKLGIKKGDRVALLQVNCNQCVEAYFAVTTLGAVYVPLNFRVKGPELAYMLGNSETSLVLIGERYLKVIQDTVASLPGLKQIVSIDKKLPGCLYYEDLIAEGSPEDIFTEISDDETTILMYTAGTTGTPKGVLLPHSSFSVYVLENVTPADPETAEKNILTVPLYHVAGIQAMMAAIYGGRTLIMERQFEPVEWMTLVAREKANRAMLVPTMLKQLIDHPDISKYDLSSLRVITYGAAPMPLPVIKKALEIFPNVSFINAFGQTETASTITVLNPEDHIIEGTEAEKERKLKRLASIGKPMSDVAMKIVDEEGKTLPPGEIGEILARGPRVMSGYWRDEEKTQQTIDKEGWVHTGDLGYRDEDGYYFLAGRSKDIIKRGGEMISPEEVENCVLLHPCVEEVAVIGIPDEEWGEQPCAVCVLKKGKTATEEEIIEHCHTRLASYKRPRSVVFLTELPRNSMGKILKRELRDRYIKT